MRSEKLKIIYEDKDLLVIDKPAGTNSDNFERRVHRLDKDTSGILLIAKNNKALEFLQKQFKEKKVKKKYLVLVVGNLKNKGGAIETLIGRSPKDRRKQKVYLFPEPKAEGKRKAITKYKVLKRFSAPKGQDLAKGEKNYTLIEAVPKTGRKHQIRCHLAYLGYPVAGDKMYGFKNQPCPRDLNRQFLHANYLKAELPDVKEKEFKSDLPKDLKKVLKNLITYDK